MNAVQIVEFIQGLLKLGMSVSEIAKRLCDEYGGYEIPCIDDFDKETRELANKEDL